MKRKKDTIENVRNGFGKKGYTLLTNVYKGNKQKLEYVCPEGHKHSIRWDHFKEGHGCPYCAKRPPINIDFVRKEFKKKGFILLTKKYINNKQKLDYMCSNGHKHWMSWCDWSTGNRCPYCSKKIKKDIEFIRSEFEKEGYKLLSTKYKNCSQKLDYICPIGHKHCMTWDSWKQGHRCSICASINHGIKFSGENHPNWKGGISCEPYCDAWADKEYKESIKERDGYRCQNPDCWKTSTRLTIHHIDYNKKNCSPNNLITLCNSCNPRANYNRSFWIKFYIMVRTGRGS
jgi:hypothetical protein